VVIPDVGTGNYYPEIVAIGNLKAKCLNLTINSSAKVEVLANAQLEVFGNFTNNGQQDFGDGTVRFKGGSAQSMAGTTDFNILELNNTAGLTAANGTQGIQRMLVLTAGTFTANGRLVIKSDANGTGLIAPSGTGAVAGEVVMQRYINDTMTGYRHFSTPFDNTTVADFNDDVALTGLGGVQYDPADPPNPFPNIWYYDETQTNPDSMMGWFSPVTLGSALTPMLGYTLYSDSKITIDHSGTYDHATNNGQRSITVTNTPTTPPRPTAQGWNFVGNPYPSPVDWDASGGWTKTGVANAIYFWREDMQQYASYINMMGTNGGTQHIPSMQGFMIKATASTGSLTVNNSARTTNDPDFFRYAASHDLIRLALSGAGFSDETVVRFRAGATSAFDPHRDAYKLKSTVPGVPALYSKSTNDRFSINTHGPLTAAVTIPVHFEAETSGHYTLRAEDVSSFDPTAFVYLEDVQTNTWQDLRLHSTYAFQAATGDPKDRFRLHFHPPLQATVTDAGCVGMNGRIELVQNGPATWNYTLTDANGLILASGVNWNGTTQLTGLAGGDFYLTLDNGQGYQVLDTLTIGAAQPVAAGFTASTSSTPVGLPVQFQNTSTGAQQYTWDFGDGTVLTGMQHPSHAYQSAGTYRVTLIAANAQCGDTSETDIEVAGIAVGTGLQQGPATVRVFMQAQHLVITFGRAATTGSRLELYDAIGRQVIKPMDLPAGTQRHELSMEHLASGYYLVKLHAAGQVRQEQVFLGR